MKKILLATAFLTAALCMAQDALAQNPKVKVRIKDVARLAGDETNILVGYGVVVGLNNTGDSDKTLIRRTIKNLLENFNVVTVENDLKAQNSAAVMVTATIRGSKRKGDMIDCSVSSIGDAKSIYGGVLLLTPLLGADAETWGIAQGSVTLGGYSFGSSSVAEGGEQVVKNVPTSGLLTNGAKLLRDVGAKYNFNDVLTMNLMYPDFTSAVNLAGTINKKFFGAAIAEDDATIKVRVPSEYRDENKVTTFISELEQMYFDSDAPAKVVFNERTGTIVMGSEVKITSAAISHGNLNINIKNLLGVSQPSPFSYRGDTTTINQQNTTVEEDKGRVFELPNTTTIGELVRVLNALGVSSRDMIMIFHALKAAGALHAELEAM